MIITALADSQGNFFINGRFQRAPGGKYIIADAVLMYKVVGHGDSGKESLESTGSINKDLIVYVRAFD